MSCKIKIVRAVNRKLNGYQLPRNVRVSVVAHLCIELADNPDRYRHNLIRASDDAFRYYFTVAESGLLYNFTFAVRDEADSNILRIFGVKLTIRPVR